MTSSVHSKDGATTSGERSSEQKGNENGIDARF
jgi:hypothetical protein